MATNPRVKAELLKRLGVTPQRLSQLAQKRKAELPMSTEDAVYTIAHEKGIDISRYLNREETAEVGRLVTDLRNAGQPSQAATTSGRRPMVRRGVKVTIAGVDVGKIPGLSPTHASEAKRMSERVYPALYFFENSVRDLIELVLQNALGKDWWITAVPGKVQDTASRNMDDEKKDPWHSKRGRREIDYVFLNELWAIIKHRWSNFRTLFPNQAWVESLITSDMNVSRRLLAHMNPLDVDDIRNIEAAFRKWTKQLQAVEDRLP